MKKLWILWLCSMVMTGAYAQQIKELKLKLNESGDLYIKATLLNQTWLRYNQSNPGTLVNSKPADTTFDIGLRRTRLQLYGQLLPRVFFYTQFGMNNFNYGSQNSGNRKLQAFFLDALGELGLKLDSSPDRRGTGLLPFGPNSHEVEFVQATILR